MPDLVTEIIENTASQPLEFNEAAFSVFYDITEKKKGYAYYCSSLITA